MGDMMKSHIDFGAPPLQTHYKTRSRGHEKSFIFSSDSVETRKVSKHQVSKVGQLIFGSDNSSSIESQSISASSTSKIDTNEKVLSKPIGYKKSLTEYSKNAAGIEAMDTIMERLRQRGVSGVVAISRKFRHLDQDLSGALDIEEFELC